LTDFPAPLEDSNSIDANIRQTSRTKSLKARLSSLSGRTKLLLSIWALFLLLVAFGVHGSSTGVTAAWWAPEKPNTGYLFQSASADGGLQDVLPKARLIRWDEFLIATPLALSQLSHSPRFPLINTNIGSGQNMLLSPQAPVLHIATLARPATWGYFVFGAQRGLAWYWWFGVFSCFTVLYLLLELILKGHSGLAAFGAFWFCASAYVVCWSLWPAHLVFFAALSCLTSYHLLASQKASTQIVCAVLLGLGIPGFVMFLYPPWQVPVGYLVLLIFVGLFIRDRIDLSLRQAARFKLLCLTGALLLASGLTLSFLITSLPDLKIMSNTVYPGRRVSLGGDYSFAMLFKGMYNVATIYAGEPEIGNESEASSFYYLFPAVFIAACLSKYWTRKLGVIGWLLVLYLVAMLVFLLIGFPERIARLTFMSYVPPYRADIGAGLASICLCVYALAVAKDMNKQGTWRKILPWIVSAAVVLLFLLHGRALTNAADGFPPANAVLIIALFAGFLSYCLLAGRSTSFCGALSAILIITCAFFNPLATNLDHIYDSELARQVLKLNNQSTDRPLWICYGGGHPGVLVTTLGGRSLTGSQWPPQLSIWRRLDKTGVYEEVYNRYALVRATYRPGADAVSFDNTQADLFEVGISPDHPVLKEMGARYVLAMGDAQRAVEQSKLDLIYKSSNENFSILEIPSENRDAPGPVGKSANGQR
jgi:hypothetical protein